MWTCSRIRCSSRTDISARRCRLRDIVGSVLVVEPKLYTVVIVLAESCMSCDQYRVLQTWLRLPSLSSPCGLAMTSTRSTLPWRSSQKNRAPTSLSLIVATPEVSSPVTSAVAHLPAIKMTSDPKTGSSAVEDVKLQEDAETQPAQDHDDDPQPERVQLESSSPLNATDVSPASDDDDTNPASGAPDPMSGPTLVPQSRSWFASLSKRRSSNVSLNELAQKQKTRAPPPSGEQPTGVQSAHPTAAVAVSTTPPPDERTDNAPVTPFVSEPQAANAGQLESETKLIPRKRAWFAPSSSPSSPLSSKRASKLRLADEPSPPVDPARKDPPMSETTQPPVMNVIPPTPPKVEGRPPSETVPVPIPATRKWFTPASSPQARSPEMEKRAPSSASSQTGANPSSLDDQAPNLTSASAGPSSETVSSAETSQNLSSLNPSASRFSLTIPFLGRPKVPLERATLSAPHASDIDIRSEPDTSRLPAVEKAESSAPEATALAPAPESSSSSTVDHVLPGRGPNTAQDSWWALMGWRDTTPHTASPAQDPLPIRALDQESVAVATDRASRGTDISSSNTPAHVEPLHDGSTTSSAEKPHDRGSSWLTQWYWYGQSTSVSAPDRTQSEEESANHVEHGTVTPKTAEALTRQEPNSTAHVEPTNPIQSTITTNISGWASFFSSRSLLAKRITDTEDREEDGMEVMEIDEGVDERGSTLSLAVNPESRAGRDPATREMRTSKSVPGPPRSPSPSTKPKARHDDVKAPKRTSVSPTPSKGSGRASPRVPLAPNLVLPTWDDTFLLPPRSTVPREDSGSVLTKTVRFVSGMLFAKDDGTSTETDKARSKSDEYFADFGKELPRTWDVIGESIDGNILQGCKRVVVIGIHGWFPGAVMRTVLGEPTGTSNKFVTMMCQALELFQEQHKVRLERVTQIPLEGEGTISKRVEKLYTNLTTNSEWMDDLHAADAILVATHSQGSIVSTHLLDRLIREKHIKTSRTSDLLASASATLAPGGTSSAGPSAQRVCCLALCGIHLGPLRYLSSSSLLQPYIQYFESAAAKELFEFQNTNSEVSKVYVKALRNVVDHRVKMVFIASLNDQVVPLYSGLFTAASHPLILRALYIDGDAYHSSDFLSNLLVLLLRVMNVGLSDSGLLTHLSEATAGSLSGIGHSTVYEELATYSLAVNYLFMTDHGSNEHPELVVHEFDANTELNDYEIPWALRDLIANEGVAHFFRSDFENLRNAFPDWHPKTAILRDIKRKLQPIQRLNMNLSMGSSHSKL